MLDNMLSCRFSLLPPEFFLSEMYAWFPHDSTVQYARCLERKNVKLNNCFSHVKDYCDQSVFLDNSHAEFCYSAMRLFRKRRATINVKSGNNTKKIDQSDVFRKFLLYDECITDAMKLISHCLPQLEQNCLAANLRVVKTIRLDVNTIHKAQTKVQRNGDEGFKVVHLVRDPRAMLNSRRNLVSSNDWSTTCARMRDDVEQMKILLVDHPRIYKQIRYEDLVRHVPAMSYELYGFIGVRPPKELADWINNHTLASADNTPGGTRRKNSALHVDLWKRNTNMTAEFDLMAMNVDCATVLQAMKWLNV